MKKIINLMLIILLFSISVFQVSGNDFFGNVTLKHEDNIFIRIYYDNNIFIPKNSEVISGLPGYFVDVLTIESELIFLSQNNINYSILEYENINKKLEGRYHTLSDMEDILADININFPEISKLYSIGLSFENRDIWCLEISDNPGLDEGEPGVLFMGVHHAREWPTMEICLNIADELTSNYGLYDNITNIVNNRRIWIVACVNPDGYYFDYDLNNGDKWWRKNRNYFPDFRTYGVDLNRNYAGSCNGDDFGMWGSTGMSHNPENNLFCGFNDFSESETQAIKDLIIENEICSIISYHTYGELVMWPWGYTTNEKTPDDEYLSEIGNEIALRIENQNQDGTYTPTQAAGLYPTTGDTCDWAYGYGHYILGRQIYPFTIEACNSFHPSENVLEQVCKENFEGALYLLNEAENISKLIPRVGPPIFNDVQFNEKGSFLLNWIEKNPDAILEYYQLEELEEFEIIYDSSENNEELWNFDGFNITDDESYSQEKSYKSHILDNRVSSMTTNYPLPVFDGTSISFWCLFDTEKYYDMAFFEVSKDGRIYDIIDTFTGKSEGWIFKNYNLDEYEGDSIFLRFRYSTDDRTHGEGFYVDDINPIPKFGEIKIIKDNLKDNFYEISNKSDGIYYYRIKGFNAPYGWGDFSTIKRVINRFEYNKPPSPPIITGKINGNFGEEYRYSFMSEDPENEDIYYYIEWGDGEIDEWIGPYESGKIIYLNHTWKDKGNYIIKSKSMDINNVESYWNTIEISMPSKISNDLFLKFINKFQNLFSFINFNLGENLNLF